MERTGGDWRGLERKGVGDKTPTIYWRNNKREDGTGVDRRGLAH